MARCGTIRTLKHQWWECKMMRVLWKTVRQFLTRLNIHLPSNPTIAFLNIYPKNLTLLSIQKFSHRCSSSNLFSYLFIIAKTRKQSRCSLVDEWINKWWYIQATEYYSAPKRSELPSHEENGWILKCILQNERSQSEKATI